ncbi:MAG: hypothetical protein H7099_09470 [Gemmatimonadaceae bacterium]|nr:hypothetical protein [Gemmatimonadaceae bacterium]
MAQDTTTVPSDAYARATALATRARELRRAQVEVQELTIREVQVLARAAASFFDAIPLVEFTTTLLPQSARGLRRIRHRVLHRTVQHTETGTLIRALLLGRDGALRLFSARSADSRDLLLILEPGRTLPVGVMRDVVDWNPTLRVPGFRPFEILDKLSHSLDAVEEQIGVAEQRVTVQKAALTSGDLSALLPVVAPSGNTLRAPEPQRALSARGDTPAVAVARNPFDIFERVEEVANASRPGTVSGARNEASRATDEIIDVADAEPEEWDEPAEIPRSR